MALPRITPIGDPQPDEPTPEQQPEGDKAEWSWLGVEAIEPDDDALSKFPPEELELERERSAPVRLAPLPEPRRGGWTGPLVFAVGLLGAAAVVGWLVWGLSLTLMGRAPTSNGTLVVESSPPGALVTVDGRDQGTTPISLSLPPGSHSLTLAGAATRETTVTIDPGGRVVQYIEMPAPPAEGRLYVETAPAGAQVFIDGEARGVSPLSLEGLMPGSHLVSLRHGATAVSQTVTIQAGAVVALVVPMTAPDAALPGWVSVSSPIEVQLFENGRIVGTSSNDRILLLSGRHELQLSNQALGYETTRLVNIVPGKVTSVQVAPPNGSLFINAVPWAEVFLDGTKIGETPIANYSATLGSHELVLRNPRLPEQRRTIVVSLSAPVRVGVDLRK
jgi:hypothetical protein